MSIDEEDLPDIIDITDDPEEIIDDDEDEHWERALRKLNVYIRKHKVTPRNCRKLKKTQIKELQRVVKDLNMLVYAEAYQKRVTYSGFINKQDALRRSIFKSLLRGLCIDGKIIVIKDLLRDLEGDDEPTEYYIW